MSSEGRTAEPYRLPAVAEDVRDPLADPEAALERLARLRRLALRATALGDWQDLGGKPHLMIGGALKIAAVFNVDFTGLEIETVRERCGEGQDVLLVAARITARGLGRVIESEGVASSGDPFFARRSGKRLALGEVDLPAVRKKAVTSAQGRAVRSLVALAGVTWQEVHGALRASTPAAGNRASSQGPPPATRAQPTQPTDGGTRERLRALLLRRASGSEAAFGELLARYTAYTTREGTKRAARSLEEMSDAWVRRTLERVEAEAAGRGVRGSG